LEHCLKGIQALEKSCVGDVDSRDGLKVHIYVSASVLAEDSGISGDDRVVHIPALGIRGENVRVDHTVLHLKSDQKS